MPAQHHDAHAVDLNLDASHEPRHDWRLEEIEALFSLPFNDLLFRAQQVHRAHFDPNAVQVSTLLSIKTGACPEDCKYCPQSGHYNTGLGKEKLLEVEKVVEQARAAKQAGASRFCMGAAWRSPRERDLDVVLEMVGRVKELGLETCMTLGMVDAHQASRLAEAGLDYYNHNLDTSPEYYGEIITTRSYADRLDTLSNVRDAGMKICSGGILGMGEATRDRAGLLQQLARLNPHPESVPINMLVKVPGTPMENVEDLDPLEFIRAIAVARILMPASHVRLSAGREQMDESTQAMAFLAGANSIFYGDTLLTTGNPQVERDRALFDKLGLHPEQVEKSACDIRSDDEQAETALAHAIQRQRDDALFYDAAQA
ncbi:biotin synthase BioB [Halomonas elongata]|uniref:Biotin synthase n=1 Tax=Halomonas elongata (strain ATCC 33173 / DSM 2581 / NBRC 15536 / NCIMB 2198 / 1H9) TaxID=768066 RepID=E1VAK8_HALED|nr:biotin synthase BioB [Halomonas elongata]MBW5798738.1 biotin synthase BioB [Halomonas elongata]WBF19327.1 biotin synthase BioB [Halomonas elongata]WPU48187.1 biotin synthase BioB [Halomonas elongata DSM 2581]CBV42054.1 biotin synthase [Halomonas elongata DSM 2581]